MSKEKVKDCFIDAKEFLQAMEEYIKKQGISI